MGEAREGAADLHVPLLAAAGTGPFPPLEIPPGAPAETRTFRSIELEDDHLAVVVVPALGGRIVAVWDKRTDRAILPRPARLPVVPGGARGVESPWGIELALGPGRRPNALGPVLAEPEDGAPACWLHEAISGDGLAWTARVSLADGAIRWEVRVWNRSDRPLRCAPRVVAPAHSADLDAGFSPHAPRDAEIAPGATFSFEAVLTPYAGIGEPLVATPAGAVSRVGDEVRVFSPVDRPGARVVVSLEDGRELSAAVDLAAGRPEAILLGDLPVRALAVLEGDAPALVWDGSSPEAVPPAPGFAWPDLRSAPDAWLLAWADAAGLRAAAWRELARRSLAAGEFGEAADRFERALLFDGEDPVAWWGRAAALRRLGEDPSAEIANLRWIAPLEPLLRAEAFLSQPEGDFATGTHPVVAPLEEAPDAFLAVAELYADHGLRDDATRWIEESLRRRPQAALHRLQARLYREGSRMTAEAARHDAEADRLEGR